MTAQAPAAVIVPLLEYLDYVGMAVFALSGAVAAAAKRLTFVTFVFFSIVTATGGGTVRDLLIGAPIFWIGDNATVLICLAAALLVWLTPGRLWGGRTLLWLDAAGLAAYSTFGVAKGMAYHVAPLPALAMGVLTACLGGIIRDVLAGEPSILIRPELYITAAALSSALMVGLSLSGLPAPFAGGVAAIAGFLLRAAAIRKGWSLPGYRR